MKLPVILIIFLCSVTTFGQETLNKKATDDFTKLQKSYDSLATLVENRKKELIKVDINNIALFNKTLGEIKTLEEKLFNIKKKASNQVNFYRINGLSLSELNRMFDFEQLEQNMLFSKEPVITQDVNEYALIGTNKVIKLADSEQSNELLEALELAFNAESQTHFGTFIIPKEGEEIPLKKNPKNSTAGVDGTLLFKRVDIELHEGSIVDIKAYLKDEFNREHIFSNTWPISFLNFDNTAPLNYLFYVAEQTNYSEDFKELRLRVSDVIKYNYTIGGNYVPDNVTFSFPIVDIDNESTNSLAPVSYKLIQSTALNNVIDFRAYTDVFALNDTESNGLASFEAQAAFFLNTQNNADTYCYWFKKIRPFVSFSRFEEEDKFLATVPNANDNSIAQVRNNLDILQKSSFRTGLDLDILSFKVKKESTFSTNLFFTTKCQTAAIKIADADERYTTLGLGAGARVELKRFTNFTLTYTVDVVDYHVDSYNDFEGIQDPGNFVVLGNQFEVSWFPVAKKNNSFFGRFRAFDDLSKNSDGHFFQAEIGYRFSLGAGKVSGGK